MFGSQAESMIASWVRTEYAGSGGEQQEAAQSKTSAVHGSNCSNRVAATEGPCSVPDGGARSTASVR